MQIHAFDLDHTLLRVNSSFEFGKYLFLHKHLSFAQMLLLSVCYIFHCLHFINVQTLHHINFTCLFKGKSRPLFRKLLEKFLDEKLTGLIYQPAYEALLAAQRSEHFVALMSSSPDFIVEAIARRFGILHMQATTYLVDRQEFFQALGPIVNGAEKAKTLNKLVNELQVSKENSYSYSDSHLDLPFLFEAGHPIAVQPKRSLMKISKKLSWTVL